MSNGDGVVERVSNKRGHSRKVAERGRTGGGVLARSFDAIMVSNADGVGETMQRGLR